MLELLNSPDYVPARLEELLKHLDLDKKDERYLKKSLPRMLGQGTVVRIKGDRIALPSTADLVAGTILFRTGGSARVVPDPKPDSPPNAPAQEPVHIHAEDTGIALHGDKVVIRLNSQNRPNHRDRKRAERGDDWKTGRVIRILSRANDSMPGTLRKTRLFWYVVPDDPRIARDILVPEPEKSGLSPLPKENDKVVVKLGEWEQRHLNPVGEIIEVLGETHTPMAEYKAILRKYRLNPEFPGDVMREVAAIPSTVPPEDADGRRDFRKILTLTIDPPDAKDFDDALSLERLPDGNLRVGIHIADVSHYVRPGSALDKEARARGNSTYLVGTVVPMLPHALSNGICSLVEGEDRLTKAAIITYDRAGRAVSMELANTIIRSRKRLTYKQAYGLMTIDDLAEIRKIPSPPKHHSGSPGRALAELRDDELKEMRECVRALWSVAAKLRAARFRKGALDLDMAETKIYVDAEGYAERAEIITNDESHQLVEEFMLAANEAVAKAMRESNLPHLSRVHDEPDPEKLSDLRQELLAGGIRTGDLVKREEVVKLLKIIKESESLPLRIRFLRSLKQACYRASADGHYGLAKEDYSHFTSPIRRYADLVEHRIFDFRLQRMRADTAPKGKTVQYSPAELEVVAAHISATERNSTDAERDSVKVKLMELFEREINKRERSEFDATITEVRNHGFNVELTVSQAFGLVHLSTLTDDFYVVSPDGTALVGRRTGRRYAAGDRVKVTVDRVDRFKRQLDFRLARENRDAAAPAPGASKNTPTKNHAPKGDAPKNGDRRRDNPKTPGAIAKHGAKKPGRPDRDSGKKPSRKDSPEAPVTPPPLQGKSGIISRFIRGAVSAFKSAEKPAPSPAPSKSAGAKPAPASKAKKQGAHPDERSGVIRRRTRG